MQEQPYQLVGRVGFVEHICNDKTCSCQDDPFIKDFRGKYLAEIKLLNHGRIVDIITLGPFETRDLANSNLDEAAKDIVEELNANGFDLKPHKQKLPRDPNPNWN